MADDKGYEFFRKLMYKDRLKSRMSALSASMGKTDRILTGDPRIGVKPTTSDVTNVPFPAFTAGRMIYLQYDKFENIGSAQTLIDLMGANYHELSHILYTPPVGSKVRQGLCAGKHRDLFFYWNVLEDQRIESLFRAMYKPAGKYFTGLVIRFMVNNPAAWETGLAYTYGRTFVPLEIREGFRDRWAGTPAQAREIASIISSFKQTDFSQWVNDPETEPWVVRVRASIMRFREILTQIDPSHQTDGGCKQGESDAAQNEKENDDPADRSRRASDSREARDEMEKQEQDQADQEEETGEDGSEFWDDQKGGDEEDGDEEGGSGGEDQSDDDGESSESDDGDMGDGSGEDDGDDEAGSEGRGGGSSEDDSELEDEEDDLESASGAGGSTDPASWESESDDEDFDLEDALEELLDSMENSQQVYTDVNQLRNAMNDPGAVDVPDEFTEVVDNPVTPKMMDTATEIEREFDRLYATVEPGWRYGTDSGRLNVQRAAFSDDPDEWFDEWDEGREQETGIDVVICLDTSISMRGDELQAASQAMWMIKRALDEKNAHVCVLSFDSQTRTVFMKSDKASASTYPLPNCGPSTIVNPSLMIARRVLNESDMPNKLLVAITDGAWYDAGSGDETIEALLENTTDAVKLFIQIGRSYGHYEYEKFFDVAKNVGSASELVPVIKDTVSTMLQRVVQR